MHKVEGGRMLEHHVEVDDSAEDSGDSHPRIPIPCAHKGLVPALCMSWSVRNALGVGTLTRGPESRAAWGVQCETDLPVRRNWLEGCPSFALGGDDR